QPGQRIGERRARRIEDREVIEAGGAGRRRRSAKALPGIERDVMMIAAGRYERGRIAAALRELEAEHAAIEAQRPFEIRDLQMHMADLRSTIDRTGRLAGR